VEQARCLLALAWSLHQGEQLDAAEEAVSRAIDLLSEEGEPFQVSRYSSRSWRDIFLQGHGREKAIDYFEAALRIASSFNWFNQLFWIHRSLAVLFFHGGQV
jgi:tetratricopeptide (TPR) repeat protein